MAEQTASKVPKIRFKGFEGEWEEQFLGELYTKIRNAFVGTATPYYTQKGHFYLQSNNVKNGEINRNTEIFINEEFYLKQKDNWLRSNDIVMVQSGHIGHTAVIPDELNNSAAHALIIISKPLRDTCSYYLNFYFQGNRARRDLANITTGNTIKHILASDIKKFGAFFTHYEEQTQIGGYFRALDSLIGLHQHKHDKLVTLKKAMLQKMFPQPGATTPEIRFKGFSKPWDSLELGNIGQPYSGLFGKTKEDFGSGEARFVTYMGVFSNAISDLCATAAIGIDKSQNEVKKGDVLFTISSETPDEVGMSSVWSADEENVYLNSFCFGFRPIPALQSDFLAYVLRADAFRKRICVLAQGISRYNISKSKVMKLPISLPSKEEQQKIGAYFRTLDKLISKHATQLQKLQQIKSACLERMFV